MRFTSHKRLSQQYDRRYKQYRAIDETHIHLEQRAASARRTPRNARTAWDSISMTVGTLRQGHPPNGFQTYKEHAYVLYMLGKRGVP